MPSIAYTCPHCRVVLNSNNPLPAGKAIKCPKCAKPFAPHANGPARPPQTNGATRPDGPTPLRPSAQGIQPLRPSAQGVQPTRPSAQGVSPTRQSAQGVQKKPKSGGKGLLLFFLIAGFMMFLVAGVAIGGFIIWTQFGDSIQAQLGSGKSTEPAVFATMGGSIIKTATEPGTKTPPAKEPEPPAKEPDPPITKMPPTQGPAGTDVVAYIPGDHNVLLGAKLGGILSMPGVAALVDPLLKDNEEFKFLGELEKTAGIGFKDLTDQVAIGVKAPLNDQAAAGPEAITAVFRSKKPFDKQKVIQALGRGNPLKLSGREYHMAQQNPGGFTTLLVPNDRILILTTLTGQKLDALLKADGKQPLLKPEAAALVRKVEKQQVWLAVPLDEAGRAEVKKSLMEAAAGAPPDAKPLLDALAQLRGLTLAGGLEGGKFQVALGLDLTEEQPARELTAGLQKIFEDQLKTKITEKEVLDALAKLPPHMQAIVKDLATGTKITQQETLVQVALTLPTQPWEQLTQEVVAKGPEAFGPLTQFIPMPAPADPLAKEEADLLKLTNEYRKKNQLPEFKPNKKLDEAARAYSMKQAKAGKLDPLVDVQAIAKFAEEAGFKFEVLNANSVGGPKVDAQEVMAFFMKDVDSKDIILDKKYEEVGIGVAKDEAGKLYFTQVYATAQK
ncbi:MAG: hypothetical protein JNM56_09265 [Planctomycetia bacterium]|nr:hypothetical protein [Planctomycetia bacterium]